MTATPTIVRSSCMADFSSSPPNPKWRWWQFGPLIVRIAVLMVLIAALAVAALAFGKLIGVSSYSAETQRQREIIQGLKGHGGVYSYGVHGNMNTPFFHRVYGIDFGSTGSRFSDMSVLVEMANLRNLNIAKTEVTDFSSLAVFTKLEFLDLTGTQIRALSPLRELKNLTWLDLEGTLVTDAELKHLKELNSLQLVSVYNTNVTDEGAASLRKALPDCNLLLDEPIKKE